MKQEALNPYLPQDVYIPDGEPHVFGDRIYLFGSHDKENGDTFCMLDYEFWSAPVDDLSDWSSKGVNYATKQDPLFRETMQYMYAPDCVQGKDGRYYLYYCLSGDKGRGGYSNPISVAVCDTPDGKYEFYGHVRNPDGSPMTQRVCFDPAVMNDEGTIRLYFGTTMPWLDHIRPRKLKNRLLSKILGKPPELVERGILGSYHVTLADDMLTITGEPRRIDDTISGADYPGHAFFEGSSLRKIGDLYYFIYSSANNHELCYATSRRPDGGFVYGGTLVSNGDIGYQGRRPKDRLNHTGTNHGSIERINGTWYVFYHRLTHNSDYSRQGCAERIEIRPDGSIPQVEITSCGLNGGPLHGGVYPATCCCNLTNGRMRHGSNSNRKTAEPCITSRDGERFVSGITNGTLIGYKYVRLGGRIRLQLTVRGAAGYFDTNLGIRLDVAASAQWHTVVAESSAAEGIHPLYLTWHGKAAADLKEIEIRSI